MTLYYTNKQQAGDAAESLACCGYQVETQFDGETYTLIARML